MMQKQNEPKPQKIRRALGRFGSRALLTASVLTASLMLAPKANAADSTNVKLSFAPKAIVRVFDNGKTPATGIGLDAQADIGDFSIGTSATLAQTSQKPVVEETSVWIGMPIKLNSTRSLYAVGYAYTDLFYNVGIKDPAFGLALNGFGLKLGGEKGKDFSDLYLKFPLEGITPGLVALEWERKLQRIGVSLTTQKKMGVFNFKTEAQFVCPPKGGAGALQMRASVQCPL